MLLLFVPCIYMPKACWHAFTCGLMLTSECCGWMSCDAVDVETVAHRVYPNLMVYCEDMGSST